MKIGIIPNSDDFSHPADRRRYINYFSKKNIRYDFADFDEYYDFVYVSISGNLDLWSRYKAKFKNSVVKPVVIFDLSDDILSANALNDFLRAALYIFLGRNPKFYWSYKKIIKNMIASADLVLCGSEEQKNKLNQLHSNVMVIREYVTQEVTHKKNKYNLVRNGELHIFWEGLSHGNIKSFQLIYKIFKNYVNLTIHVHIVTDPLYCKISGRYNCSSTYDVISKIFMNTRIKFHLYDWNVLTFSSICSSCDIAIIPIPDDPIMLGKPENKLLLLWEIGIPTVTSATASYKRVMANAGLDYIGADIPELIAKIEHLVSSEKNRIMYAKKANKYIQNFASDNLIDNTWDTIFYNKDNI